MDNFQITLRKYEFIINVYLYADYTGNKELLQKRLEKLNSMKEAFPEHKEKLNTIETEVDAIAANLPVHYKESMVRDLANVR